MFSRYIKVSIVLHVALAAFFLLHAFFAPTEPIELRNAIRVDVVGLPDKIRELEPASRPEAKPAPPPAPAVPPPASPKVTLKKSKFDSKELEKKALERIKALDAIDAIKKETSQVSPPTKPQPTILKGNVVNSGDSLSGLEKIQYEEYFSDVKNKVHDNFHIPQWLADADLHAQALVQIDEDGLITRREIVKSSGNDIFDSMVLEALDKSSPLSKPPSRLVGILKGRGAVFNFPD